MDESRLANALSGLLGIELARDLAQEYVKIHIDYATKTYGRASAGKFVETFVQGLQHITKGSYDQKPNVEDYLAKRVENATALPEGLRVCAARIARSVYALRNKRNIAHKGEVDPNSYDLAYINHATSWIVAELVRSAAGLSMEEAGALVEMVQVPVGPLVEDLDGSRLVHAELTIRGELLVLLHSHYPAKVPFSDLTVSLRSRSPLSVRNELRRMRDEKLAHGDPREGFRLTQAGHRSAQSVIEKVMQSQIVPGC